MISSERAREILSAEIAERDWGMFVLGICVGIMLITALVRIFPPS